MYGVPEGRCRAFIRADIKTGRLQWEITDSVRGGQERPCPLADCKQEEHLMTQGRFVSEPLQEGKTS